MGDKTEDSENLKKGEKVFFPGINALRFFAAFGVIITHIELLKATFGYKHYWNNPIIFNLGGLGVYFFFVLSGFLITFLLLKEKEKSGRIKIKQFYLRRILRIWPLYYLICIIGFFILPHFTGIQIPHLQKDFSAHYRTDLLLYILILPNLAFSLFSAVPHIGQLWSIGVEEQFYLAWPWLISKTKNVLRTLFFITGGVILFKISILFLGTVYSEKGWYQSLKLFTAMSKFECMAIGGIGAQYLYSQKQFFLKFVYHPFILNSSIVLLPLLMIFTPDVLQDGIHIVFSVIFLIIIVNVASNKKIWLKLENKYFSYLGKISYGIYMYHLIIIPIVLFMYKYFGFNFDEILFNVFVYVMVVALTVLISGLSFSLLENRFIKFKEKFTVIRSGTPTKEA